MIQDNLTGKNTDHRKCLFNILEILRFYSKQYMQLMEFARWVFVKFTKMYSNVIFETASLSGLYKDYNLKILFLGQM